MTASTPPPERELHDISLLELIDNEWPEGIVAELTLRQVNELLGDIQESPYVDDYDRRLLPRREPWRYDFFNWRQWETGA